jgi:hypothetical protein
MDSRLASYLIRLDDACPTMDKAKWQRIEDIFDDHGVRPIVAVVPDNEDGELQPCPPDPEFWERARTWQQKGWAIGLHGYKHSLRAYRGRQYLPMHRRSEFAGFSLDEQRAKIRAGWARLRSHDLTPTVWVAPAHSFDHNTLKAVHLETPLRTVSDGIAVDQFDRDGFRWIPQQLWSFVPKSRGLWTVCLHPNTMDDAAFVELDRLLRGPYRGRVVALSEVESKARRIDARDRLEAMSFWRRHYEQRAIGMVKKILGR